MSNGGMSKSEQRRGAILRKAVEMASLRGLNGITIGDLAEAMPMSKSGLFVHFGSKEALQLAVIETVFDRFRRDVIQPGLAAPEGRRRIEALFGGWVAWSCAEDHPGGCPMLAAVMDADAAPGLVRDRLADGWRLWREVVRAEAVRATTIDLRHDADAEEVTRQVFALYLEQHVQHWLLDDAGAPAAARRSLAAWLDRRARRRFGHH
jgi:AcrR family transcriptional regulator